MEEHNLVKNTLDHIPQANAKRIVGLVKEGAGSPESELLPVKIRNTSNPSPLAAKTTTSATCYPAVE